VATPFPHREEVLVPEMRAYKPKTNENIETAITKLKEARDLLKAADAPKTLARVRRALRSAEGARRHAWHRESRRQERSTS